MLLVAGISKIVARSEFDRICSGPDLRPSGADHDVFGGAACMRSRNTRLARFGDYPIQIASCVRWARRQECRDVRRVLPTQSRDLLRLESTERSVPESRRVVRTARPMRFRVPTVFRGSDFRVRIRVGRVWTWRISARRATSERLKPARARSRLRCDGDQFLRSLRCIRFITGHRSILRSIVLLDERCHFVQHRIHAFFMANS